MLITLTDFVCDLSNMLYLNTAHRQLYSKFVIDIYHSSADIFV